MLTQANPTQTLTHSSLQFLLGNFKPYLVKSNTLLITTSMPTRRKLRSRKSMSLFQIQSLPHIQSPLKKLTLMRRASLQLLMLKLMEKATKAIQMDRLIHTKKASEVAEAEAATAETRAATTTESTTPMRKASPLLRMKRTTTTTTLQRDTRMQQEATTVEAEVATKRMAKASAVDVEVAAEDPGLLKNIKM